MILAVSNCCWCKSPTGTFLVTWFLFCWILKALCLSLLSSDFCLDSTTSTSQNLNTSSTLVHVKALSEDTDLLAVSSRHYFLNEHHWSLCTVSSALDDEPQACSLGNADQLNDTVTGKRNTERVGLTLSMIKNHKATLPLTFSPTMT